MKNPELYEKTVGILVDAYFNDTLSHGDCATCAVGNIISAHFEINIGDIDDWRLKTGSSPFFGWGIVFCTTMGKQDIYPDNYVGSAKRQIDITGYTFKELAAIEFAFETAAEGENEEGRMFNGLMAVIEALDIIHENTDTEVTVASKKKFNKALI